MQGEWSETLIDAAFEVMAVLEDHYEELPEEVQKTLTILQLSTCGAYTSTKHKALRT